MKKYIIKPIATEKSIIATDKNKYTFKVTGDANKDNLAQEINHTYKVVPVSINVMITNGKKVMRRGHMGSISGYKKAIVTLKKGDKIEII